MKLKTLNMKNLIIIAGLFFFTIATVSAQEGKYKENINKAIVSNGTEYFADGTVKVTVNINKLNGYYEWAASADTISAYTTISSWDASGLLAYKEASSKLDLTAVSEKCKLWSKAISSDNQYANNIIKQTDRPRY